MKSLLLVHGEPSLGRVFGGGADRLRVRHGPLHGFDWPGQGLLPLGRLGSEVLLRGDVSLVESLTGGEGGLQETVG